MVKPSPLNIALSLHKEYGLKNRRGNGYIRIEGKLAVKSFMSLCVFPILNSYLFCLEGMNPINHTLKSSQFKILNKLFQYLDSGLNKYVLEARIYLIKYIYSFENKREHSAEYWIQIATEIFNKNVSLNNQSGYTFINFDKISQSWVVRFPKSLEIKPATKQFKFTSFNSRPRLTLSFFLIN